MELVGRKQTIKKKEKLDFLAAFPAIVSWYIAKSKQVVSSVVVSLVSSERHHINSHLAINAIALSHSLPLS